MMRLRIPKTLEIPPIDDLKIGPDVKQWLRQFSHHLQHIIELLAADIDQINVTVDEVPVAPVEITPEWRWYGDGADLHVQHWNPTTSVWESRHTFEGVSGPVRFIDNGADLLIQVYQFGVWTTVRLCEGVTGTYRWVGDAVGLNLQVFIGGIWETKWTIEL